MQKQTNAVDYFRLLASLLVVANHTSPLASYSTQADFILVHIISRIAVPFFLMASGYFLLGPLLAKEEKAERRLRHGLRKTALLYLTAIVLYLPVNIYAGHFNSLADLLRSLFFAGTFYHLWYLPALLLALPLLALLLRKVPYYITVVIAIICYFIGLAGDSYYGLIQGISPLKAVYHGIFTIFGSTRNGLFLAPIFLLLGAGLASRPRLTRRQAALGATLGLAALLGEGLLLQASGWPRHDSMYLSLPILMYCVFSWLLTVPAKNKPQIRLLTTWVYLLHPLIIIVVRGVAKLSGWQMFVDNSLLHFLAVALASLVAAWLVGGFIRRWQNNRPNPRGRAWVEIDLAALRHNVEQLQAILPSGCRLMPVLKADAYGHGALRLGRELNRLGMRAFCVASLEEGIALRRKGVRGEILVLGYTHPQQFSRLRCYRLTQTVLDEAYAMELQAFGKTLRVQVKVDTGLNRLGTPAHNLAAVTRILSCSNLRITGLFSHLSTADSANAEDVAQAQSQMAQFDELLQQLAKNDIKLPQTHLHCSYSLLNYPEQASAYARCGIVLYGAAEQALCRYPLPDLQPVLTLKARVSLVRTLLAGEYAGYGRTYRAGQPLRLAVLAIGYADGLPRNLASGGLVLLHGQKAPIIGRVCMDQLLVDVTQIPQAARHDTAVIIGKSGGLELSAVDQAHSCGTIANEILSRLGQRLPRVYV